MATVLETLKGVSAYPVPFRTLVEIAEARALPLNDIATAEIINGRAYRLAKADLLLWLALAPNISQGGQSYSFGDEQRRLFRSQANALFDELGEAASVAGATYGYKGSRL